MIGSRAVLGLGLLSLGGCAAFIIRSLRSRTSSACSYVSRSGKLFPLEEPRWCDDSNQIRGAAAAMLTRLGITRRQIHKNVRMALCRILSFGADPISLGEAHATIQRLFCGSSNVYFKCEWFNPTCSFKDRGTTVMLSLLKQQGVSNVLEDSSGNGGASVACYAAAGGLDATIMAPDSTAPAKTVAMRAHGAAVRFQAAVSSRRGDRRNGRDNGRLFCACAAFAAQQCSSAHAASTARELSNHHHHTGPV